MRVESDSFWYKVKIVSLYQIRTYMHGKLHETTQCLKIDYLIIDCRLLIIDYSHIIIFSAVFIKLKQVPDY